MFRYDALEAAILDHVTEFQLDALRVSGPQAVSRNQLLSVISDDEKSIADLERRRANLLDMAELADSRDERVEIKERLFEIRRQIQDTAARLSDNQKRVKQVEEQTNALQTVSETIKAERAKWTSKDNLTVFQSRAMVSQALLKFITLINVHLEYQVAIVEIAGGAKGYVFNRDGELIDMLDMTDLPFEQFAAGMKIDGKTQFEISQAKAAYDKMRAAS